MYQHLKSPINESELSSTDVVEDNGSFKELTKDYSYSENQIYLYSRYQNLFMRNLLFYLCTFHIL